MDEDELFLGKFLCDESFAVPDIQWIAEDLLFKNNISNDDGTIEHLFNGFDSRQEYDDDEISDSSAESTTGYRAITEMTDNDIKTIRLQELNKLLRDLPREEAAKIRRRRRYLKNRGYALTCRQRRQQLGEDLMSENFRLKKELDDSREEIRKVSKEKEKFKTKYLQLRLIMNT